ncbi:pseudouridine synthase [Ligilactobacillus apodemi]|uniref:Pseudouridine synthase n=1 Tax=Ligilactobacillus apodemi DSM 16634 = JCM 16172 TaxID=1423724 RepID=A0A0R1TSE6_9LACO|nr:pseudouridine synthase [Ligilactobacillus apodemi]KRL84289.1 16S pseudouridylate synthase [Ligilactobacillus apodemi DSM 16634 = JCM 16172]
MRLDKYLATVGVGTRSAVKKILKQKQVTVDEITVTDGKLQIDPNTAKVKVGEQVLNYQANYYYMLNKPKGVVSATKDQQKTVLDLLGKKERSQKLFPVGRLDKDTTGLLLLTNDGALSHELLAPKKHVAKVYRAQIAGGVSQETCSAFAKGISLKNGEQTKPAQLRILAVDLKTQKSEVEITISEGKYHQIKRMFGAVGMRVLELKRLQMGSLKLDQNLALGKFRPLTENELADLKAQTK